eukprot:4992942-Prymnesium_polylepis.1
MVLNWIARAGGKPYANGVSVEVSDPRGAEQMRVTFAGALNRACDLTLKQKTGLREVFAHQGE